MNATTTRKLNEIRAAGTAGLLVKNGLTAGMHDLRDAGLVTVELVDQNRGPSKCGWYLVTATVLTGYAKLISDATGVTDPATLAVIEELMREQHPALDGLPFGQFCREANLANDDVNDMIRDTYIHTYCKSVGLAVPAGAPAP